jgi:hypothetical protein
MLGKGRIDSERGSVKCQLPATFVASLIPSVARWLPAARSIVAATDTTREVGFARDKFRSVLPESSAPERGRSWIH